MRLKDKVAIVTGATLGIGKAAALLFAKEGALVTVVGYKHVVEGQDIVSSIEKNGGKVITVPLTKGKSTTSIFNKICNLNWSRINQFGMNQLKKKVGIVNAPIYNNIDNHRNSGRLW